MVKDNSSETSPKKKFALPLKRKSSKKEKPVGYFRGAWQELRQVRWPDRRTTWNMTLAVILFSIFFAAIILSLDYVFQLLFKEVIL